MNPARERRQGVDGNHPFPTYRERVLDSSKTAWERRRNKSMIFQPKLGRSGETDFSRLDGWTKLHPSGFQKPLHVVGMYVCGWVACQERQYLALTYVPESSCGVKWWEAHFGFAPHWPPFKEPPRWSAAGEVGTALHVDVFHPCADEYPMNGENGPLIHSPHLLVQVIIERFLPAGGIFKVILVSESQWLQPMLILSVHWWPAPAGMGSVLVTYESVEFES